MRALRRRYRVARRACGSPQRLPSSTAARPRRCPPCLAPGAPRRRPGSMTQFPRTRKTTRAWTWWRTSSSISSYRKSFKRSHSCAHRTTASGSQTHQQGGEPTRRRAQSRRGLRATTAEAGSCLARQWLQAPWHSRERLIARPQQAHACRHTMTPSGCLGSSPQTRRSSSSPQTRLSSTVSRRPTRAPSPRTGTNMQHAACATQPARV